MSSSRESDRDPDGAHVADRRKRSVWRWVAGWGISSLLLMGCGSSGTVSSATTTTVPALSSQEEPPVTSTPITEPAPPPETSATTATTASRGYRAGSRFSARCTIAWPSAPMRSASGTELTTTCSGVPSRYQFVQVFYPDPDLDVTPAHPTMDVEGEVVDSARSELGYEVLAVRARRLTVVGG